MKTKTIKRLWNGLASMRDYEVTNLLLSDESVQLKCVIKGKTEFMTLTPEQLRKGFDATMKTHQSKFNDRQTYALIDFRWRKDNDNT